MPASLRNALFTTLGFIGWSWGFRLVAVSIVTYFLSRSGASFQEVSDSVAANEITIYGVAAFVFFLIWLNFLPVSRSGRVDLWSPHRLWKQGWLGWIEGAATSALLALGLLIFGVYLYQGFFIQTEEWWIAFGILIVKALAILSWGYVEELLFRGRLLPQAILWLGEPIALAMVTALSVVWKWYQFPLGWMSLGTLTLFYLALGLRASHSRGSFERGAGVWCGLVMMLHLGLSLPILGHDAQGVFTLRYDWKWDATSSWVRLFSGGSGGPLSSFLLQCVLIADILKSLLIRGVPSLK